MDTSEDTSAVDEGWLHALARRLHALQDAQDLKLVCSLDGQYQAVPVRDILAHVRGTLQDIKLHGGVTQYAEGSQVVKSSDGKTLYRDAACAVRHARANERTQVSTPRMTLVSSTGNVRVPASVVEGDVAICVVLHIDVPEGYRWRLEVGGISVLQSGMRVGGISVLQSGVRLCRKMPLSSFTLFGAAAAGLTALERIQMRDFLYRELQAGAPVTDEERASVASTPVVY